MSVAMTETLALPEIENRVCPSCRAAFSTIWRYKVGCDNCVDDRRRLSAEELREHRILEYRTRLLEIGIEGRLTTMTLNSFRPQYQQAAYDAACRFVGNYPKQNLALLGKRGSGKTHLGVGILLALIWQGMYGRYVHLPTIFAKLRMSTERQDAEEKILEPLFGAPIVVFDDVGREKPSDHMSMWLDVLINDRWVQELPTVICANLIQPELEKWLGEAASSRFTAEATVVQLRPDDMRLRKLPPVVPQAPGDPTRPCMTCAGAGWLTNPGVPVGHKERAMQCPGCAGRGF